jgi:uncharacterized protein VirK/YbjX
MTFDRGQMVTWPHAPGRLAQVVEVRRTCVRLFYKHRTGLIRQPVVRMTHLEELQRRHPEPPLPLHNPYSRANMRPTPRRGGTRRAS